MSYFDTLNSDLVKMGGPEYRITFIPLIHCIWCGVGIVSNVS